MRSRYRADGVLSDSETIENLILAYEAGNQQAIETLRRHFGAPAP